jgi:hypothetical protein
VTETERLQALHADVLEWLAVLAAELAKPPADERVLGAMLRVSRAADELWRTLHGILAEDRLVADVSPPTLP